MSLADLYRKACETPSDIYKHLPTLADLVVERDAKHVIELGTRTGVSTTAFLYALEKTGGRLTSIDLEPKPAIGDFEHWAFIQGDDLDPKVFAQLDNADLVFIDTTHGYRQTLRELHLYSFLVERPGLIVLHDTELEHPLGEPLRPSFPVRRAIEEFCEAEGYEWTNTPGCYGLGIVEVV